MSFITKGFVPTVDVATTSYTGYFEALDVVAVADEGRAIPREKVLPPHSNQLVVPAISAPRGREGARLTLHGDATVATVRSRLPDALFAAGSGGSDTVQIPTIPLCRLLQSKEFAVEMAAWLDGAYYRGQGQTPPAFNAEPIDKSVHENVAMNLAGFYAVECGVGVIAERTGQTPAQILSQIVDGTLPESDMLLLARFANATWKAGQPFRSLDRITRANFIPAIELSDAELKKDFDQIRAAAEKIQMAKPTE